jgi:adenosylmethionine-8-amino-7-oxononanoate aminotransferase
MAERVTAAALEAGLVVWPNVGHADGEQGDLVLLAPPFTVSEDELDEMVARLCRALEVGGAVGAPAASTAGLARGAIA